MQFRPSSRSSTRTRSAHNSPTIHAHMDMDMNVQENHNSSPLRTISFSNSNSNSNSNTSTRLFRNSATNVMRTIIDSPRRALLNRKKRLSAHHHRHNHNQKQNQNHNLPDESKIMAKSSPILQHYDENYVQVHSHSSLGCQDVDVNMNLNMHMPMQMHINMNMHGNNMKRNTNMNMSLFWLEYHAPQDIVPKVLSFAGPQMIQILSRVSKSWNETCLSEAVFRTLSEDTGKWVKGTHEEPQLQCDMKMNMHGDGHEHEYGKTKTAFWRNYYRDNPIVPLDYRTIPDALAGVCTRKRFKDQTYYECDRDVRILLHPALYSLKSRVVVETLADATFAVETHNHYCRNRFHAPNSIAPLITSSSRSRCNSDGSASASGSPPAATKRRLNGPGLREIFNCRTSQAAEDTSDEGSRRSRSRSRSGSLGTGTGSGSGSGSYHKRDATIVLRTRADNTPIFHIRQGRMRLSRMNLIHECTGVDIWNGNAAVQIQPRHEERANHHPVPVVPQAPHRPPSALVEDSKIMSVSGRGIVAIDGSAAYLRKCHIYKCAATGVYIGGPGSTANVLFCDIVQNGIGNVRAGRRRPRGRIIARGHSGFYLEQGRAVLQDCNISRNALTGISAVSPTNAILEVRDSDIVANGTLQIELPPQGSISYRKASNVNNRISKDGQARVRSGFKLSEMEEPQASASEEDDHASNMSESEDW